MIYDYISSGIDFGKAFTIPNELKNEPFYAAVVLKVIIGHLDHVVSYFSPLVLNALPHLHHRHVPVFFFFCSTLENCDVQCCVIIYLGANVSVFE